MEIGDEKRKNSRAPKRKVVRQITKEKKNLLAGILFIIILISFFVFINILEGPIKTPERPKKLSPRAEEMQKKTDKLLEVIEREFQRAREGR